MGKTFDELLKNLKLKNTVWLMDETEIRYDRTCDGTWYWRHRENRRSRVC